MNGDVEELGIDGIADAVRIGRGGNSIVYRARQLGLDRTVAVKVIRTDLDDGQLRRFEREQRAVGRLSDVDGILTVYASGITDAGDPYLVMPYLEAGSLADQIKLHGPVPWQNALPLMARVARAIHEAHQRGVFHGDLKPHNLLLDTRDRAQVVDFGIARLGDATLSSTSASFTPAYAPPEFLESTVTGPNVRSDVYGLGISLATLLDGRSPFGERETSGSIASTISNVLTKEPDLPANCPASLRRAVLQATAKDPADRPASALELAEMLEAMLEPSAQSISADSDATRRVDRQFSTSPVRPPEAMPVPRHADLSPTPHRKAAVDVDLPASDGRGRSRQWALLALVPVAVFGLFLLWRAGDNEDSGADTGSETADSGRAAMSESPVRQLAAGNEHACALEEDGQVWCWGANSARQLGQGSGEPIVEPRLVDLSEVGTVSDLVAGFQHTCVLNEAGGAWCWGSKALRQLDGLPHPEVPETFLQEPVRVEVEVSFASITAGDTFTCALDSEGAAWCWGNNDGGRLGVADPDGYPDGPLRVGGGPFVQITSGGESTCAIDDEAVVWCWGTLTLEDEPPIRSAVPVLKEGLSDIKKLVAGDHHFCALDSAGAVRCWGRNNAGQLGNNTLEQSEEPVQVLDLPPAADIAADWFNTCALSKSDELFCWGLNGNGQLGTGQSGVSKPVPIPVALPPDMAWEPATLTLGNGFSCLADKGGWVWCWGNNTEGQLGVGGTVQEAVPTPVEFNQ